jgi:ATP-dependent Clp protease ATP-binding subunit ClpB
MSTVTQDIVFSEAARRVIKIAQAIAKENMHTAFSAAHLLKALLHKEAGLQPVLKGMDQDIYYIEEWADVRMESLTKSAAFKELVSGDAAVEEVLTEADTIRLKLLKDAIEPLHILAALSTPGVGFSYEQLKTFPLQREQLLATVTETEELKTAVQAVAAGSTEKNAAKHHALLKYCTDKTLQAREGKTDPIVGRDKEVRMMAEILCRRSKPNVLIAGEPGVGKTALVDGFALAIVEQQVPVGLQNARLFELDTGALIAGASYKGEIEDRLKNIIQEIKQFDKAILFIDEIHALIDKHGSAGGAVNLLKPELARGTLTIIGATTLEEYRKYIESDEAFNRRFELLTVEEPDNKVCFQMIKKVAPIYEKHHGIQVPDDTIKETIRLAKRYIKDKRLPDAAIDVIDRSMAALGMINDTAAGDLQAFSTQYTTWDKEDAAGQLHTEEEWQWLHLQMKHKLSPILWTNFQSEDDPAQFEEAAAIKAYLRNALDALQAGAMNKHTSLQKSDVAAIVSYKTGIPIGKVQVQEKERLLNMEAVMKQRVIGQDHAIKSIAEAILESRSGLSKPGQPIGSFFFLGPTGTGKTELAKTLASFLFQDESFMIRFDMSEFKEEHSAALLYGAPPGYVGYEEGGLLVNRIRQKPYSVVLFDEIEKAHTSVFDIFLQILDEGKLHDKLGKEGDFSNAVIIFTSNIGSQYVVDAFNNREVPPSAKLMEIMAQHFRPEFLGRLTEIIPFAPMTEVMVQNILHVQLQSLYAALEKQGITLSISDKASLVLARMGFTPRYGARPLSGVIRSQLRKPLSRRIISGEIARGSTVQLDVNEQDELVWR